LVRVYLTENPTGRGLFLFFHTSISESGNWRKSLTEAVIWVFSKTLSRLSGTTERQTRFMLDLKLADWRVFRKRKQDLSSSERRRIVFRPGRGFGIRRCFGIKRNVKTEA